MKHYLFLLSLGIVFSLLNFIPHNALAHERQRFLIGGQEYQIVIGSLNEPIFVDDKTGVYLQVTRPSSAQQDHHDTTIGAVEGLETTLKVEISAADKKKVMDLSPAFGEPGIYHAPFFPTIATTYNYRVFGNINNTPVNLTFTCNPAGHPQSPEDTTRVELSEGVARIFKTGAFGCPRAKADAAFPEAIESSYELLSQANEAATQTSSASRTATIALLLSIVGIALGSFAFFKKR